MEKKKEMAQDGPAYQWMKLTRKAGLLRSLIVWWFVYSSLLLEGISVADGSHPRTRACSSGKETQPTLQPTK